MPNCFCFLCSEAKAGVFAPEASFDYKMGLSQLFGPIAEEHQFAAYWMDRDDFRYGADQRHANENWGGPWKLLSRC